MTNETIPGYYNHCAICGEMAGGHDPQDNHKFEMRDDEGVRASYQPEWSEFERLEKRVEILEEYIIPAD